jgi:predicted DNA-binding transcriptional regulator YafY
MIEKFKSWVRYLVNEAKEWQAAWNKEVQARASKKPTRDDEIAALRALSSTATQKPIKASAERKAIASEAMRREHFADRDAEEAETWGLAPKAPPTKFEPDRNVPKAKEGNSVWIEYCDARGVITERTVLHWERDRYELTGWCTLVNGERTFKLNRVVTWGEWT